MTTAEVAEMTAKIHKLEYQVLCEQANVKYWKDVAEMMRLRAQALSEEVELLK